MNPPGSVPPGQQDHISGSAASIRALYPTPEDAPSRVMKCVACGGQRWVGYGPCGACDEPSPWSDDTKGGQHG